MILHNSSELFKELIARTSHHRNIPERAVRRDYYIVMILKQLENSEFFDDVVFKGGTSLSKCYPGTIERFSEDIDLTLVQKESWSNRQYDRTLKEIERQLSKGFRTEKIDRERSSRNKSSYLWYEDKSDQIKLEIGSSVMPYPYEKKDIASYIQEYLEFSGHTEDLHTYHMTRISLNALDISRTFIDKVLSIKRHAVMGTLYRKVRHIYDVVMLYRHKEVERLLMDRSSLKDIIGLTKAADVEYMRDKNMSSGYDPQKEYRFEFWKHMLDADIKKQYETLHEDLLYTNESQSFDVAIKTLQEISRLLTDIGE